VKSGRHLFGLLRSEGESLSKLDLHLLRTQLFILQVEVRSLEAFQIRDERSRFSGAEGDKEKLAPSISAMVAYLKVGDRLRATRDHYPAHSGAIGCIRHFQGMPGNWYVGVE
jgi:hypothetical protein